MHRNLDPTDFEMPYGAKVIDAQIQGADICLWAICDPEEQKQTRRFAIVGTGHRLPSFSTHVATVQDGQFVWHIFEVVPS